MQQNGHVNCCCFLAEQQEKLNNLQEALTLVHTGVRASAAARRTGVSANELKSYMKQVDNSKR